MINFDGLTISQLKICYKMFSNEATSFNSKENPIRYVERDGWEYYLIYHKKDNNYRVLFDPVTLYANIEPSARDLSSLLKFYNSNFKTLNISRIVIPIGEVSKPILFQTIHHMVTLIIDFLPDNKTSVQARIIDSYRFSFPGSHQSKAIADTLSLHYTVKSFKREYLSHQNWLDRQSCCYFTLKVIQTALNDPIQFGGLFVSSVPSPDTWIYTSHNWLTLYNKREVHENLTEHFQKMAVYNDSTEYLDDIVEVD